MPRYKISYEVDGGADFVSNARGNWAKIPSSAEIERIEGPLIAGDIVKLKSYEGNDRKTVVSGPHKTIEMGTDVAKYLTADQDGHHALIREGLLERVSEKGQQ